MGIIEKYILPIMQFLFIFGIPIILVIVAIVILCNVFLTPYIKTAKSKVKSESNVRVVDKRKEVFSNPNGIYTIYFITFQFASNERIELKTTKGIYFKANNNDICNIKYKEEVELLKSLVVVKKSGEYT